MMYDYIYLVVATICISMTGILGGYYNRKNTDKSASALYSFVQICSVFVGWLILYLTDFSFDVAVLPYSLGFGVGYTLAMVGMIKAMDTGSVALTSLIMQLSLIGTTIWGFFFWGSKVTPSVVIGLGLVAVALVLCLYNGKEKVEQKNSKAWLMYVTVMFLGNACCTIFQKNQQLAFDGKHGAQLMCFATFFALVLCFIRFLRGEKGDVKRVLKTSAHFPILSGVSNVCSNFFVLLLAVSPLSPSLVYPVLSVGGLMVTMLFSLFAFHEKIKWWQWLGIAFGASAVALLSI
ncbi:MAG: hypothetical protein E7371_04375 [Clostridiales bacterium]|nr:hypothetical protein [Clostridiales bacterium]